MVIVNLKTWCSKYIDIYKHSPHELNEIYEFYSDIPHIWIGYVGK